MFLSSVGLAASIPRGPSSGPDVSAGDSRHEWTTGFGERNSRLEQPRLVLHGFGHQLNEGPLCSRNCPIATSLLTAQPWSIVGWRQCKARASALVTKRSFIWWAGKAGFVPDQVAHAHPLIDERKASFEASTRASNGGSVGECGGVQRLRPVNSNRPIPAIGERSWDIQT